MTVGSQTPGKRDDPFACLYPYDFVLLTAFRDRGIGVPTAMWLALEHGKLSMDTSRRSGRIKRIRHIGRVFLAPCDLMGNVLGQQIAAFTHELPDAPHADALLARK
jgi:PPOX class probable F420-dependent enzyme